MSEHLNCAIESAKRCERGFALMFVDLDRFKYINDTFGHAAGDELLKTVAGRLSSSLRSSDLVARLGGDEFVVLLSEIGSPDDVELVAKKILGAVMKPVELAGQGCNVTGSLGISLFPLDAQDEQGLMTCADKAMYQAKRQGKNQYCFYQPDAGNA